MVEITQADRECAALIGREKAKETADGDRLIELLLAGKGDGLPLLQAIAAHRTQSTAALQAQLDMAVAALVVQEDAETKHANCQQCDGDGNWSECSACAIFMGNAIDIRRDALAAIKGIGNENE